MRSIESRIRNGLVATLLLSFTVLAVVADYGVRRLSENFVATRLEHDADNLIKALTPTPDGGWTINEQNLPLIYQRVYSGHYYQVRVGQQRLRSRSLWDKQPPLSELATGTRQLDDRFEQQEHWLVWQQGVEKKGQPISLWIAEDIAPFERDWRRFSLLLYGVMAAALVLLLLLQRRLIRQGFSSLDRLRGDIHQLRQGDCGELSSQVPLEIQPLTTEINQLLERLAQRTSRSRTAIGNLAHELKRLLQRLALLQAHLPQPQQAEYQQVVEEVKRLTERELRRARIAGDSQPGRHFQPRLDLQVMVEMLQRLYPDRHIRLQMGELDELPLDRDDMLELIGNLAENACKYSATQVAIELTRGAGQLRLEVVNDGQLLPESLAETLMRRGTRTDESIDGFGLGLSICKMIVDSYGGTIEVSSAAQAQGNLTRFVVRLPC